MAQARRLVKNVSEVQLESEQLQQAWGNRTTSEFVPTLPEMGYLNLKQNDYTKLVNIWESWDPKSQDDFVKEFGDLAQLLYVRVDQNVVRAAIRFWDPTYKCFSLGRQDLMPTIEEYTAMLSISMPELYRIFVKKRQKQSIPQILRKVTGLDIIDSLEYQVTKGSNDRIHAHFLLRQLEKGLSKQSARLTFALAMYGMVIFPKALEQVDARVIELFSQVIEGANPVPAIVAETIRSLDKCRRNGDGRFSGCLNLLYMWFAEHVRVKRNGRVQFCYFHPIAEFNKEPMPEEQSKEQWIQTFLTFEQENVVWTAPWMSSCEMLYKCGNHPWVPLPGLWGIVSYAPLQVRRQFGSKQFIPVTHDMTECEFSSQKETFDIQANEILNAWKSRYYIPRGSNCEETTATYQGWSMTKARNVRIPGIDSSISHASWFPQIKPPTELDLAEERFSQERADWEVEKNKLMEKIMDLEMTIHGKDKRIKEVEDDVKKRDSHIEYTSLTPAAKRKRDAESYKRLLEHNFTPEMYELQDEVKRLKEKVRQEQEFLYHSGKRREQEVGKAEYEASRARKDAQQTSDKLKNLKKIATKEVDKLQKQLQELKQHNEDLHRDNIQLQKQNERLRRQKHEESHDRRHAQMVQANELLKEECAQMHTENARLHHEFHEMQQRWEIERTERLQLTEDNQQWQQSNEARQAYMELTIESLTVAQERDEGMIMEINAINWGIGSKVLYSPYLEVLAKAKARFEQVVEFATRVKREQRIWLRRAKCPIDTEMKALQEKIEEEEE